MPKTEAEATTPVIAVASGALPGWDAGGVVRALTAAGVTALEVAVGSDGLIAPGDIEAARALGLRLSAAGISAHGVDATAEIGFDSDDAPRVLASASVLGAGFARFFAPTFVAGRSLDEQLETAALALAELVASGQRVVPAVNVFIEVAAETLAPSPELARRLIERAGIAASGSSGVILDPGNMVAEGHLQPGLAVAVLGDLLRHVHVKNRVMSRLRGSWTATAQTLATGYVDWGATLSTLAASGYRGAYALDHLSGPPDPATLITDIADLRAALTATRHTTASV